MANVKPFRAIRPSSALAAQVAALPYDVYNREEAAEKVKGHPLSFLNIDRPETQFDPSMDMYADCVYEKAKEMLDREIAEGVFVQDEQKCYYLYELTMHGRTQTGITACVSIDDYLHQVVKKHEDTRAEKEQDRIRHVDVCSAQTGPIFLTYRTNPILSYIGWGCSGGEAGGMITDSYLAADGIENVIRVLEDLEDEKFARLQFIELNACSGGCVGGVLNVENPYVAKAKIKRLNKYLPVARTHSEDIPLKIELNWNKAVEYEPVFQIGETVLESINKMKQIDSLCNEFPGLDCGSCGAPSCRALAEDIVRGKAEKNDCVYILRNHIHLLSETYSRFSHEAIVDGEDPNACIHMLMNYMDKLTEEIALLDSHNLINTDSDTEEGKHYDD